MMAEFNTLCLLYSLYLLIIHLKTTYTQYNSSYTIYIHITSPASHQRASDLTEASGEVTSP